MQQFETIENRHKRHNREKWQSGAILLAITGLVGAGVVRYVPNNTDNESQPEQAPITNIKQP